MSLQEERQNHSVESQLDALLQDYMEKIDRGLPVDQEAIIVANPDLAEQLRDYFATEASINRMAGPMFAGLDEEAGPTAAKQNTSRLGNITSKTDNPKSGTKPVSLGIPEQFGRYRILKQLGAGAMGEVYLAEDTELHRKIALKIPLFNDPDNAELIERFYREARTAATLRHANICPVYDVGEIEGIRYISMAYIEGIPLSEMLKSAEPITQREIANIICKLALGLADAHELKIIHRDLKPANIVLDKKGEPVVMDFGLACITTHSESSRITKSGEILGTPAYMSPEQIDADLSKVGPGCDIYSLGIIFYELLARELPFLGSVASVLGQIITQKPEPPGKKQPEVDAELEAICMKMISKSIAERHNSMQEVARDLTDWLNADQSLIQKSAAVKALDDTDDSQEPQASKSVQELTESSHTALVDMTRELLEKHDYEQVVQLAEKISPKRQTAELASLFEKARRSADEIAYLSLLIQDLQRKKDYDGLIPKLKEYLKLKPANRKVKKLLEEAKEKAHYHPDQNGGNNASGNSMSAWIFEDARTMIAVGLISFVLASVAITMYLKSDGIATPASIDTPAADILPQKLPTIPAAGKLSAPPAELPGVWKIIAAGEFQGHTAAIDSLIMSPDGSQIHSTTLSGRDAAQFWDVATGSSTLSPVPKPHGLFLANQQFLYAADSLQRYHLGTKKTIWTTPLDYYAPYVALTPDQSIALVGGFRGPFLFVYDMQSGERLQKIDLGNIVWDLAVHPDGKTAWIGSVDEILVLDLQSWKVTQRLKERRTANIAIHFTPDGEKLISAANSIPGFLLWDVATKKVLQEYKAEDANAVTALSFLPDNQQLVLEASVKAVRLWDIKSGKQLAVISAETNRFNKMVVSPDGKYFFTAGGSSYDSKIKNYRFDGDYHIYKWQIKKVSQPPAVSTSKG